MKIGQHLKLYQEWSSCFLTHVIICRCFEVSV